MKTELIRINPENIDEEKLNRAVCLLKEGELVAFPTDTVYGLGANVFDGEAVKKIFKVKERVEIKPLAVLIADISQVKLLASEISPLAESLMEKFWPGGLTLIFKAREKIPKEVTAGKKTIGLRIPRNSITRSLIKMCGFPLAATSANLSGHKSSTEASQVLSELGGKIRLVIDGGATQEGKESTVLDLIANPPKLIREGAVSRKVLENFLEERGVGLR